MKKKRRNSINTVPDSGKSERCQSWNEKEWEIGETSKQDFLDWLNKEKYNWKIDF
jgi:hypothetical protein